MSNKWRYTKTEQRKDTKKAYTTWKQKKIVSFNHAFRCQFMHMKQSFAGRIVMRNLQCWKLLHTYIHFIVFSFFYFWFLSHFIVTVDKKISIKNEKTEENPQNRLEWCFCHEHMFHFNRTIFVNIYLIH